MIKTQIKKNFKFKVGLDVDDVLLPCVEQAIEWANNEYKFDPPITLDEVTEWSACGKRTDVIMKYFEKEDFFRAQKPFEGAQKFVRKLSKKAEIFAVTAIPPEFMGIRFEQIRKFFPEIPESNYIPAIRKEMVNLDFLLDDGAHNVIASDVTYPVLFRKPWNQKMTGILSVDSYDDFLIMFDSIRETYVENSMTFGWPTVIALVGPSGSGKTEITNLLVKNDAIKKPISATTRDMRSNETFDSYHFVTNEEFDKMEADNVFAEKTIYAGERYGSEISSINNILKSGKHCVIPIDISGALALKKTFRTCIIYINRNRQDLIRTLIDRAKENITSTDDIVKRIESLDDEAKNMMVCDYTIYNNGTLQNAADKILELVNP